jgi:hypothetical protein
MPKPKTHFEQIPLNLVLKIVKEQVEGECEGDSATDKKTLEKDSSRTREPVPGSFPMGCYRKKL